MKSPQIPNYSNHELAIKALAKKYKCYPTQISRIIKTGFSISQGDVVNLKVHGLFMVQKKKLKKAYERKTVGNFFIK